MKEIPGIIFDSTKRYVDQWGSNCRVWLLEYAVEYYDKQTDCASSQSPIRAKFRRTVFWNPGIFHEWYCTTQHRNVYQCSIRLMRDCSYLLVKLLHVQHLCHYHLLNFFYQRTKFCSRITKHLCIDATAVQFQVPYHWITKHMNSQPAMKEKQIRQN